MKYLSTRGQVKNLSFEDAVMTGLADDGGLIIPSEIPFVDQLQALKSLSFAELSHKILGMFIEDEIDSATLKLMIQKSYQSFRHAEITPVRQSGSLWILELFHGPTFAFKDVALQFLGNLFEYFLEKRAHQLTVLGATSGDTGSAAIYGLRGKKNIEVFMLHPQGRVSLIQEKQMTTVLDKNIHNIAVEGTFDDAQNIVKTLFNDQDFKQTYHLGAVNSINWARILAQIVYYFYAYFRVVPRVGDPVNFSVPTGNFGDVLAGFYAKKMGLPIDKLIVATNQNDILYRLFTTGKYHTDTVVPTWSPSMDIQISSNFERFLYYLGNNSSKQLNSWMNTFHDTGKLTLDDSWLKKANNEMTAERASQIETLETIKQEYSIHQYLVDPHTAVGICAAKKIQLSGPVICLATAHPAKFGDAVTQAIGKNPELPESLAELTDKESRVSVLPAKASAIKAFILQTLKV
ncbi:MAG: threonine synthase [SAR324 cluster bacterium]|nr:threonine synthase [SAR324 cluster bacterium]